MKNIFKLTGITLFTGLVLLSSCKKDLQTTPQTSLAELRNFDDIRTALKGCYAGFQSGSYYNNVAYSGSASGWSALPDLMGDDMVEALESLGNWRTESEMSYAADFPAVQGVFTQPYEIISRANNLLNFIDKYETGDNAAEAKTIKAQALAIRAHAHFDLMRYFAPVFDRNSDAPGVAYVTVFDALNPFKNLPARNKVKEDYDKIYADLEASLVNFRDGGNTPGNDSRNYIDSTVVYAMLARVDYYASDWNAAIRDASIALDLRPLTDAAGFTALFSTDGEAAPSSEVYWAIPSDGILKPGGATNGSSPSYRVSTPLTNIILAQGGAYADPSLILFNQSAGAIGGFPRTLSRKYADIKSFKVFRAGEMMLIRAEAKQRTGDLTALTDLNMLRTNRNVATGSETGDALLKAILIQRRVELLCEGHRWFDIKRTTRTIDRTECGNAGGSASTVCSIASTSRAWAFPIPFNEKEVNPNLIQNDGY